MNQKQTAAPNGLSTASLIFGILALLGSITIVATPLLSGLAITFSWLSRGDKKMNGRALAGNIMGVLSILVTIVVIVTLLGVIVGWILGLSPEPSAASQLMPFVEELLPGAGSL